MLDKTLLNDVPDFTEDINVSIALGYLGQGLRAIINNKIKCPRDPISQSEFDGLVAELAVCVNTNGINNCRDKEYVVNQYLKADFLITSGNINDCDIKPPQENSPNPEQNAKNAAKPVVIKTNEELDAATLENGRTGLGTLLLPYLYIRWGTTVLHNTFPSFLLDEPTPQIRNNVAGFELTVESASEGSTGISTCELTLNPHLVDENGDDIIVQTDGAELLLIWGYPNSNQVRTHTFAQVGIKDNYYNEQKTQVSFRGRTWKLARLSEQKRYSSGKLKDLVINVGRDICKAQGYLSKEECPDIIIDPPDALDDIDIGETSYSGSLTNYLRDLVGKARGCTLQTEIDSIGTSDRSRNKLIMSVNCDASLNDIPEPETNLVLVDRAMWLGQGLAETVELSDVGDTSNNFENTGGSCGGSRRERVVRPENLVLQSFNTGCNYRVLNRSNLSNTRANTQGEFILQLALEGETDVAILSPFNGEVVEVGPNPRCPSTNVADNKCGGTNLSAGSGNYITLKANEPGNTDLDEIFWTFYYLNSVNVSQGDKVTAGQNIATQGSSGVVETEVTGIKITREDTVLAEEEGLQFIDDYIQTITYPCSQLLNSCILTDFVTSGALQPGSGGTKWHFHYETLRGSQDAVQAFDSMAGTDDKTCYNLNQRINGALGTPFGDNACWNTAWDNKKKTEFVESCNAAHSHRPSTRPNQLKCDFWIFDKNDKNRKNAQAARTAPDAQNRPVANPYPTKPYRFFDTNVGAPLGAAVIFFDDANNPGDNSIGFDSTGQVFAQILHGDSAKLNAPKAPGGPVIDGCGETDEGDPSGNLFLANADVRSLTSNEPRANSGSNWYSTAGITQEFRKLRLIAGHSNEASGGTPGSTNTSIVYRGRNRTLEAAANIRVVEYLQSFGEQLGYDISIRAIESIRSGPSPWVQKYEEEKSRINSEYVIEFHFDAPGSGRAGVIPPLDQNLTHIYDLRLGQEFGRFSRTHENGLAGPRRGIRLIELGPMQGTIEQAFLKFFQQNDASDLDPILESYAVRFFEALENQSVDLDDVTESASTSVDCGPSGKYGNMSDSHAQILNEFCAKEGCNAKDVAAFIMAECSWDITARNSSGCSGIFQCCPGQAPEARMKEILVGQGINWFNGCRDVSLQPLDQQLIAWKAYKQASNPQVPINAGLCLNYTQIALPALVPALQANINSNFKDACLAAVKSDSSCRKFFSGNQNTWFVGRAYETAELNGICNYARRVAVDDPRLNGGCNFDGQGTVSSSSSANPCTNSSGNRQLNARNTGTLSTGGLRNLKFRQEIRLNASFGVCPRNVFLAPTDPNGKSFYILLANMDNSEGFADFKIRSVTLSWQGSWRWNITAYRPADDVTYELPPTLTQPRTLNEWINYYWFLDRNFFDEASQFAPPGVRSVILSDGTIDPNIPIADSELTNEASIAINKLLKDIEQTYIDENKQNTSFTEEQADRFESQSQNIREVCTGIAPDCLRAFDKYIADDANQGILRLTIRNPNNPDSTVSISNWLKLEIEDPLKEVADFTSNLGGNNTGPQDIPDEE